MLILEESQNWKQVTVMAVCNGVSASPGKHKNLLRSLGTIWAAQVWPCQSFETVWEIILDILLWPGYNFFSLYSKLRCIYWKAITWLQLLLSRSSICIFNFELGIWFGLKIFKLIFFLGLEMKHSILSMSGRLH